MQNNQANKTSKLQINDPIAGAEYANFMQINHNKEEFQLIFGNILPPSGRIVSKILTTPGHFKRMIAAMQENLKKYEKEFGEIKEPVKIKDKEIGF